MAKTTATHYEHIDEMSKEFELCGPDDFMDSGEGNEGFRYWHLRIQLSIAQQLSIISASLKQRSEE